ncbi:hypothetical protein AAZX31_02G148600 [Glycine max]
MPSLSYHQPKIWMEPLSPCLPHSLNCSEKNIAPIFAEEALEGRRETVRLYSVDQVLVVCKEDDKLPSSPRKALFEGVEDP